MRLFPSVSNPGKSNVAQTTIGYSFPVLLSIVGITGLLNLYPASENLFPSPAIGINIFIYFTIPFTVSVQKRYSFKSSGVPH